MKSDSLRPHGLLSPARLLCPWDFQGRNIGVGLPFLSPEDLPNPKIDLLSITFKYSSPWQLLSHSGIITFLSYILNYCLFPSLQYKLHESRNLFFCIHCCDISTWHCTLTMEAVGFPAGAVVSNPSANAGDVGLISGSARSSGEGHSNILA